MVAEPLIYEGTQPGDLIRFTGHDTDWKLLWHVDEGIVARPYGNPFDRPRNIVNGVTPWLKMGAKHPIKVTPGPLTFQGISDGTYFTRKGNLTAVWERRNATKAHCHNYPVEPEGMIIGEKTEHIAMYEVVYPLYLLTVSEQRQIDETGWDFAPW